MELQYEWLHFESPTGLWGPSAGMWSKTMAPLNFYLTVIDNSSRCCSLKRACTVTQTWNVKVALELSRCFTKERFVKVWKLWNHHGLWGGCASLKEEREEYRLEERASLLHSSKKYGNSIAWGNMESGISTNGLHDLASENSMQWSECLLVSPCCS